MSNFDQDFFANSQPRALTKGGIVGYHKKKQIVERGADLNHLASQNQNEKPWKKHNNKNKREKLRRKTSHFDQTE